MFDNADAALGLVGDLFFHCFLNRGYRGRSYKIKFHFKGKVIHERCIFHPFCIGEKPRNILSCFSFFFFSYFFVNTVLTQIDVHTTMNFKSFLEFLTQSLQCVYTKNQYDSIYANNISWKLVCSTKLYVFINVYKNMGSRINHFIKIGVSLISMLYFG